MYLNGVDGNRSNINRAKRFGVQYNPYTILTLRGREPDRGGYLINLFSISRHLERIADHTTNIAEEVIYMVEGVIKRHPRSR